MTDPTISKATVYQGETQFLSWNENEKGRKVVLMLDPLVGDVHPFKQLRPGRRLMVVAVLIGDDEVPEAVQAPAEPRRASNDPVKSGRHFRDMKRSAQAALKCRDVEFQNWIGVSNQAVGDERAEEADNRLKSRLSIISKRELDTDHEAASRWDSTLTSFDYRDRT